MRRVILAGLLALFISNTAYSFESRIAGAADPLFQEALAEWLAGEDEKPLLTFVELAKSGSRAARLLLTQIDRMPSRLSPYLSALTARQRKSLLRATEGKFPQSWLAIEAEHDAFAQALFDDSTVDALYERSALLIGEGEYISVNRLIRRLQFAGDDRSVVALGMSHQVPAESRHLVWESAVSLYRSNRDRSTTVQTAIQEGYAAIRAGTIPGILFSGVDAVTISGDGEHSLRFLETLFMGGNPKPVAIEDPDLLTQFDSVLLRYPPYGLVQYPCQRLCPREVSSCAKAAFHALGGHYGVITKGSPLESIIPSREFNQTERAVLLLLEEVSVYQPYAETSSLGEISPCLWEKVKVMRQRVQ